MNEKDKRKLKFFIRRLLSWQDDVTHWNEKGLDFVKEAQIAIVARNKVEAQIVDFVDSLVKQ